MSDSPDYEKPGEDMNDEELAANISCLLREWFVACDRLELLDLHSHLGGAKKVHIKHECPDCGEMIHKDECPTEAPDWVCEPCHLQRYYDDPEWRRNTDERRNSVVSMDQDPHYTVKSVLCPKCNELYEPTNSCYKCDHCWSCLCACDGDDS